MASAQSTAKIEELIQEDQNVKGRRELIQKQSDLLSKITRHLSVHDNRTTDTNWSDSSSGAESSPRNSAPSSGGEWKNAFDAAANGSNSFSRSSSHNRRYSDPAQSGIEPNSLVANSGSRRIPNRPPPPLPQSTSSSMYKY